MKALFILTVDVTFTTTTTFLQWSPESHRSHTRSGFNIGTNDLASFFPLLGPQVPGSMAFSSVLVRTIFPLLLVGD